MRIRSISVTKLFGVFDHVIPLNRDERITIIHGPNGYGKTVILQLLSAIFEGRWSYLRSVPYQELVVELDDGSVLKVVQKTDAILRGERGRDVSLAFTAIGSSSAEIFSLQNAEHKVQVLVEGEDDLHLPRRATLGGEADRRSMLAQAYRRLSANLGKEFQASVSDWSEYLRNVKIPDWLKNLQEGLSLRMIRTQRLESIVTLTERAFGKGSHVPTVNKYAEEIAEQIKETLALYAARSQELDSSFPTRLFEQGQTPALASGQIREKLSQIEDRRTDLTRLGFLDPERDVHRSPQKIDETKLDVLSVYVNDIEEKLAVFDTLATRIKLLTDIVNRRFKYKTLSVNKENGFFFASTVDREPLPLDCLSSGEQHELILLYELLFKVKPDSLILIDEPEISLHIAWQQNFLSDLIEMVKLSSFDVLLATHSPAIVGKRWDLTVDLKGP